MSASEVVPLFRGTPEELGGCPTCGGNDGELIIGPDRYRKQIWIVCRRHRFRWLIEEGSTNFADVPEWERNEAFLSAYIPVPLCPRCAGYRLFRHACEPPLLGTADAGATKP